MRKGTKEFILTVLGATIGLVSGYVYYKLIGCENGCPIKSNPWLMMAYGGIMGGLLSSLLFSLLKPKNK
jgi:hypothetical protein